MLRLTRERLYNVVRDNLGAQFAIRDLAPFLPDVPSNNLAAAVQRMKKAQLLEIVCKVKNRQSRYAIFAKTERFFLGVEYAAVATTESSTHTVWRHEELDRAVSRFSRVYAQRIRRLRGGPPCPTFKRKRRVRCF